MNDNKTQDKEVSKVGLVLSAGGSAGAFATGVIQYLLENKKRKYNLVIGSSTGSLMTPSVAFGNAKRLIDSYSSVDSDKILTVNPFKKKGMSLSFFNIFKNIFLRRKKALGDNAKLLKLIRDNLTEAEYRKIQMEKDIEILICVNNATINSVEYKSSKDWDYKQFTEWMFASCTEPIIFENYVHDDCEYNDGAVLQHTAIEKAIEQGCTEIDVVCNNPIHTPKERWRSSGSIIKGFLDVVLRTFGQQIHNTFILNMKIGQLLAEKHGIKIKFYSPPYRLTINSLDFNSEKMKEWSSLGFVTAKMHDSSSGKKDKKKKQEQIDNPDAKLWVRFEESNTGEKVGDDKERFVNKNIDKKTKNNDG